MTLEYDAYPVQTGDTWQAGRHVFTCRTLFGTVFMPPGLPYLVYTDPPWNQGLVSGFHSRAGLPKPTYSWIDIYQRVIALAGDGLWPCFMEGGRKQAADVMAACHGKGRVYQSWDCPSWKPPGVLHYCGPELPEGISNLSVGRDTPDRVMAAYPGPAIVLDPCAGLGGTAVAAEKAGWSSVNYELDPKRMSAALARTGHVARRVRIPVPAPN